MSRTAQTASAESLLAADCPALAVLSSASFVSVFSTEPLFVEPTASAFVSTVIANSDDVRRKRCDMYECASRCSRGLHGDSNVASRFCVLPPTSSDADADNSRYTRCCMDAMRAAYDEVYVYTMGRPQFILQHVVDAFAAQTASESSKPIGVVFALVGLYLRVEKRLSGRQVQQVHQQLGRQKREWPRVPLPNDRGRMTAIDVLAVPAGAERDKAIDEWCQSVWIAFRGQRQMIIDLLHDVRIGES